MLRGVEVNVGVNVAGGMAATVCVEAALAVWAMNVPIALGSSGGMGVGVTNPGTHPISRDRIVKHISNFIFGDAIFPLGTGSCLFHDLFHASNRAALQPDLDPVWMRWGFCKNVLHNATGQLAGALILFQDDQYGHARFDGGAGLSIHRIPSMAGV